YQPFFNYSISIIPIYPFTTLFTYTTLFRSLIRPNDAIAPRSEQRPHNSPSDLFGPNVQISLRSTKVLMSFTFRKSQSILRYSIRDRKSTRLNYSHGSISYAVFCLKTKIYNN